ncbi:major capsid protein [uncultured Duncaniella sp.]|uniref:major capsid protein n=1 Tax=uncultured Duncaniella sp. TaxID=2768039 RepID=UPI0025F865B4|nr:major capsid protein [uncultured Duncaniella sp.]
MPNPFGKDGGPVNSVPRNTFDLSFQNNLTLPFGALVPCFCKEVLPGDSFRIDTTFGLRFMPTAFPLQTRIRADVHFFYVRNRNLWKDWPDFYGKTKNNLSFPLVGPDVPDSFFKTGSLANYLGVPTALYSGIASYSPFWPKANDDSYKSESGYYRLYETAGSWFAYNSLPSLGSNLRFEEKSIGKPNQGIYSRFTVLSGFEFTVEPDSKIRVMFQLFGNATIPAPTVFLSNYHAVGNGFWHENLGAVLTPSTPTLTRAGDGLFMCDYTVESLDGDSFVANRFAICPSVSASGGPGGANESDDNFITVAMALEGSVSPVVDYPDLANKPYGEILSLSALPFRAYESIYNAFYRDERNNPFVIDGEKEYNKYLPTQEGGFDNTNYEIRYRNWEQDFLTTAVASPQQGIAPLVGISAAGVMSIQDPDSGQVYQVQAITADDNDTIVNYDVTETLPKAVTRSLVNYASSGISINDFRNVNAFQRWLETNIRRGYKYRDQIKSHYDVDVSFQELDMPEFKGGVSCDVTPNTVSQTAPTDEPLGSYAGQLYGSGSSKNSVDCYCDEHGFIIGILSVVPVPNYSQLLPKHFLKTTDSLDYYSPEFGHIGLQAISNSEVSPLHVTAADKDGVFGYQRAWYDYLQSVDEVHGQFRTTLRDFVMNRVWDNLPVLGPSFTVIDPVQLNDVFTVREIDGEPIQPILGQLYFDVKAKRPIPRYGVPRLE